MRCDIVMATWNSVEMTRTALASVRDESNFPYRLVLVDNSDDEGARAAYRAIAASGEYGETLLIQNDVNIGWLKATNIGLRHADAEYICLLNNDVVCGTGWLRRCIDLFERESGVGLINPRGNERSENARVKDVNAYAEELAKRNRDMFTELDHCSGFCLVIRKSVLDQTGPLDEIFDGGYFEDNDISRKAQQLGYYCVQCDDAFVFHLGSQSFRKMPEERIRLNQRNREIHHQRWGVVPRLLVSVHGPGITADKLIALIRSSRVYLIRSQHIPEEVLGFRHQHLILLENKWLWQPLYFLQMALYLSAKRRIDAAQLIFSKTI